MIDWVQRPNQPCTMQAHPLWGGFGYRPVSGGAGKLLTSGARSNRQIRKSDAEHGFTDVMIEMNVDCSEELASTYNAGR